MRGSAGAMEIEVCFEKESLDFFKVGGISTKNGLDNVRMGVTGGISKQDKSFIEKLDMYLLLFNSLYRVILFISRITLYGLLPVIMLGEEMETKRLTEGRTWWCSWDRHFWTGKR